MPQPGQPDNNGFADGGCANCLASGNVNGLDGGGSSAASAGGGGGGYSGGGGGEGGDTFSGGGGGGAGSSYVAASAEVVTQTTSQLAQGGMIAFTWGGTLRDVDSDGIPDRVDRCRGSDLRDNVTLGRCDSQAGNDLDVHGCTITDRIVKIARRSDTRSEFLERVRRVAGTLVLTDFITPPERRAIQRCAADANFAKLRR